ncbi:hypothetical protein P4472_13865 [Bacillus subtilis]|nr:hypothetical protein [Bacillus subtilis]MED3693461.1 hypothetical protein [Bacillus subtilis]WEY98317.1 hypothetical protein P5641_11705 [Bacillus subtilis]
MHKLQSARIKGYDGFLTITLSKMTKPGDGKFSAEQESGVHEYSLSGRA